MTDLHCTAVVNTALQSNYPSIKKKNCHVITFLLKIHRGSWGIDIPWTRSVQFQRPSHSNASGAGGWWSFWLWGAAQCLQLSLAVWLVPPSAQKPSSDFRRAPIARGHRHLEDFYALPMVWTESRLMSSGVNGSVLWLASCLIISHPNGAECPCWTICEIFGLLCFIHSDSWRLLRWSAFTELLFKKLLLYIRILLL